MKNETARREIESLDYYLQNHTDDYSEESHTAMMMAIKALEQEPCDDAISRQAVLDIVNNPLNIRLDEIIKKLPPVTPQPRTGHCKDCKYFEYDSVAKVEGVPLIVAHEICSRWGDGCKTKENGYCFLYEPQESEEEG